MVYKHFVQISRLHSVRLASAVVETKRDVRATSCGQTVSRVALPLFDDAFRNETLKPVPSLSLIEIQLLSDLSSLLGCLKHLSNQSLKGREHFLPRVFRRTRGWLNN
jgi:hypothetical protein